MKQLYVLLFFFIFSTTILTAQWGNTPKIFATDNHVFLYGNGMAGELYINDTTIIGNDPHEEPYYWHFVTMLDTATNYLWHKKIGEYSSSNSSYGEMGFTIDNNNSVYIASATEGDDVSYYLLDSILIDSGMYILQLDDQGEILHLHQPTQWDNTIFSHISLTTDDQNNLYVAGIFDKKNSNNPNTFSFGNLPPLSTNSGKKSFIVKFDEHGNPL